MQQLLGQCYFFQFCDAPEKVAIIHRSGYFALFFLPIWKSNRQSSEIFWRNKHCCGGTKKEGFARKQHGAN